VLQRHNFAFLRALLVAEILHRELQGNFDGRRSIIRKEQVRQLRRQPFLQPCRQLFGGTMRKSSEDNVLQFSRLLRDGCSDPRIRMAVEIHPPRRNGVHDFSTVSCVEIDPFRTLDLQRRRIKRGVCEGMPDAQR